MRVPKGIRGWLSTRLRPGARALGRLGERHAARYLARNGLELLASNVHLAGGEIDLVFRQGRTLVFVEVKSTSEGSWSRGFERIDADKRRSLRRACRAYLQRLPRRPRTYRLDAVSVSFTAGLLGPRVREILWEKGFFPIDE